MQNKTVVIITSKTSSLCRQEGELTQHMNSEGNTTEFLSRHTLEIEDGEHIRVQLLETLVVEKVFQECHLIVDLIKSDLGFPKKRGWQLAKQWNPADRQEVHGHCMYAVLAAHHLGVEPTRSQVQTMRVVLRDAWARRPAALVKVASVEGVNSRAYIAKYLTKGWGGLPEFQLDKQLYNEAKIAVVDKQGRLIWCFCWVVSHDSHKTSLLLRSVKAFGSGQTVGNLLQTRHHICLGHHHGSVGALWPGLVGVHRSPGLGRGGVGCRGIWAWSARSNVAK